MDISESFAFIFEDEGWLNKVLIGGLVGLIPVVGLATAGYWLHTLKNVAAGKPRPLPEWGRVGDYLAQGLVAGAACAVYALPLVLLMATTTGLSALAGRSGNLDLVSGLAHLCVSALACLAGLYALFLGLWLPAAAVRYAQWGVFAAFFEFGEVWRFVARNLSGYIVALLVAWLAGVAAALIGAVFLLVGMAFTGFAASLIGAHMLGQLLREAPQATA